MYNQLHTITCTQAIIITESSKHPQQWHPQGIHQHIIHVYPHMTQYPYSISLLNIPTQYPYSISLLNIPTQYPYSISLLNIPTQYPYSNHHAQLRQAGEGSTSTTGRAALDVADVGVVARVLEAHSDYDTLQVYTALHWLYTHKHTLIHAALHWLYTHKHTLIHAALYWLYTHKHTLTHSFVLVVMQQQYVGGIGNWHLHCTLTSARYVTWEYVGVCDLLRVAYVHTYIHLPTM